VTATSFVLADRYRVRQLLHLGQTRGLFYGFEPSIDGRGIGWAEKRIQDFVFATSWLGPGSYFDPGTRDLDRAEVEARRQEVQYADDARHLKELNATVRQLRFGGLSLRAFWAIHYQVLKSRSSEIRLPDVSLGHFLWGTSRADWPQHWHSELLSVLRSLSWLHVSEDIRDDSRELGGKTALLSSVEDLRGDPRNDCGDNCPDCNGPRHNHILVRIGRGFLGILESLAAPTDQNGVRTYSFPIDSRNKSAATLRRLGKTCRLMSVYLPAMLGNVDACRQFSSQEHRLLQALVRETTRKTKADRAELGEAEVSTENSVPLLSSRKMTRCPYLDATGRYVGFNGNGKRKRLGYLLASDGGWLYKAGYCLDDIEKFLRDLDHLSQVLGLIVVGLLPADRNWWTLSRMRCMTSTPSGRNLLRLLHVRIFVGADYVERWNQFFGWSDVVPATVPQPHANDEVVIQFCGQRGHRRQLALGIGVDASLLSKVLSGRKPWPAGWLERARTWISAYREPREQPALPAALPIGAVECGAFAVAAQDYLQRGFSVVPQLPGAKQPRVKWKPFQARRPTPQELAGWAQSWPNAGLALVLGPVSGVMAIDVDGPEAHQALLEHLGSEPLAPKVLSGSRQPYRYHLFFRCPAINTKAKATPWHKQLEFRAKGGIVILPPSLHKSGQTYAWAEGQSLDDLPLSELPDPILAALSPRVMPSVRPVPINVADGLDVSPSTRDFLSGMYGESAGWNERLYRAGCDLKARGIQLDSAVELLLAGATPWDQNEADNAVRTIHSAYSQPREPSLV
jgi:hypothetical protein